MHIIHAMLGWQRHCVTVKVETRGSGQTMRARWFRNTLYATEVGSLRLSWHLVIRDLSIRCMHCSGAYVNGNMCKYFLNLYSIFSLLYAYFYILFYWFNVRSLTLTKMGIYLLCNVFGEYLFLVFFFFSLNKICFVIQ